MLHASFSQDDECLAIGVKNGFAVYNCHPLGELVRRDVGHGALKKGIGLVTMLRRTNILGLVGGGAEPFDAANKVLIWDESLPNGADKVVAEVEFKMPVIALQFRPNRMVVCTELHMFVYSFPDNVVASATAASAGGCGQGEGGGGGSGGGGGAATTAASAHQATSITLLAKVATTSNPTGVLAVNQVGLAGYAATAGTTSSGSVYFLQISGGAAEKGKLAGGLGNEIVCHPGEQISGISISIDGALLVTASTQGTVVKLIDTKTKATLRSFTRGMFAADIKCLGISKDKAWVCVASDKTIHIFNAKREDGAEVTFKPPAGNLVCTFGGRGASEQYVYAVCRDGTFFRLMEEAVIPPPSPVVSRSDAEDGGGDGNASGNTSARGGSGGSGGGVGGAAAAAVDALAVADGSNSLDLDPLLNM